MGQWRRDEDETATRRAGPRAIHSRIDRFITLSLSLLLSLSSLSSSID